MVARLVGRDAGRTEPVAAATPTARQWRPALQWMRLAAPLVLVPALLGCAVLNTLTTNPSAERDRRAAELRRQSGGGAAAPRGDSPAWDWNAKPKRFGPYGAGDYVEAPTYRGDKIARIRAVDGDKLKIELPDRKKGQQVVSYLDLEIDASDVIEEWSPLPDAKVRPPYGVGDYVKVHKGVPKDARGYGLGRIVAAQNDTFVVKPLVEQRPGRLEARGKLKVRVQDMYDEDVFLAKDFREAVSKDKDLWPTLHAFRSGKLVAVHINDWNFSIKADVAGIVKNMGVLAGRCGQLSARVRANLDEICTLPADLNAHLVEAATRVAASELEKAAKYIVEKAKSAERDLVCGLDVLDVDNDDYVLDPDAVAKARTSLAKAWHERFGVPAPASLEAGLQQVAAAAKERDSVIAEKLPKFQKWGSATAQAAGWARKLFDAKILLAAECPGAESDWVIRKNDVGIPEYRSKGGLAIFKDTNGLCLAHHLTISQDYQGGGRFTSKTDVAANEGEYGYIRCP